MDSRGDAHQMNKFFVVLKEVFPSENPDWRGLVMLRYPSSGTNCALDSLSLWRPRRPQLRWRRLHGESSHENGLTFLLSNTFPTQIRKHLIVKISRYLFDYTFSSGLRLFLQSCLVFRDADYNLPEDLFCGRCSIQSSK